MAESNPWKHLKSGSTNATDPKERATALFSLISPSDSATWDAYLKERRRHDAGLRNLLKHSQEDGDPHPILLQIRSGAMDVLENTGLSEQQKKAVADGIVPTKFEVQDSGYGDDIRSAELVTRIYSPTNSAAIDVQFEYYHRTRWESVEFNCEVSYKIVNPVTHQDIVPWITFHSRSDWTTFFEMELEEDPPGKRWYASYITNWGLSAAHAEHIQTTLFGHNTQLPANAIDSVDTMRLLLAAVGIQLQVARTEEGEDRQARGEIVWEMDNADWIAHNIRKACRKPLERDATFKLEPPYNPYEDEDDDEDDEEYDEY